MGVNGPRPPGLRSSPMSSPAPPPRRWFGGPAIVLPIPKNIISAPVPPKPRGFGYCCTCGRDVPTTAARFCGRCGTPLR